jgi:guanylate kinase
MRFTRPTLVTITAPTCSGKNYLRDYLEEELKWHHVVGTTTRASRLGEVNWVDYNFLSKEEAEQYKHEDAYVEMNEFGGQTYGVLKKELDSKVESPWQSTVILTPEGIPVYQKYCASKGWDLYKIFISTTEEERLRRLNERTLIDIMHGAPGTTLNKLIASHTHRVLSISGAERNWLCSQVWDAVVPGTDADKALEMIKIGIETRNKRTQPPRAYEHATN